MDWQAVSAIVNSLLAAVTVGVLLVNRQQVAASRKQADAAETQAQAMKEQVQLTRAELSASKEQFRQNQDQVQEALEVSVRPFVFPVGSLGLKDGGQGQGVYFDFDELDDASKAQKVTLKNGGAGIAFNVWGVLMQPPPAHEGGLKLLPRMRSATLAAPLPVGGEETVASRAGPFAFQWDTYLGDDPRYKLCPGKNPAPSATLGEPPVDHPYRTVARLTITYTDIFGKTHASQFDYIEQHRWVFVRFVPRIRKGVEALGREYDLENLARQQGLQGELEANRGRYNQ